LVRVPAGLALWLSQEASGDDLAPPAAEDAFSEFVNLFGGHLLSRRAAGNVGEFTAFLPEASTRSSWPEGDPDAELRVRVHRWPLEIRFWARAVPVPEAAS
jgi:hypothetical protein